MLETYRTGDLIRCLGITRDTLRFYEEKGLLSPAKDLDNQYRSFDILDVYRLMIIDFMKKRGMSLQTIGQLLHSSDLADIRTELGTRKSELHVLIEDATATLRRIEETEAFSADLESRLGVFCERPMPPVRILGELSEFDALEEYAQAKDIFAAASGDMLSKIVRFVSFDDNQIIATRMLITAQEEEGEVGERILFYPDCLYYVAEEYQPTPPDQEDLISAMHRQSRMYAAEHGYRLVGEAYATIRLITFETAATRSFIEIYTPFTRKSP